VSLAAAQDNAIRNREFKAHGEKLMYTAGRLIPITPCGHEYSKSDRNNGKRARGRAERNRTPIREDFMTLVMVAAGLLAQRSRAECLRGANQGTSTAQHFDAQHDIVMALDRGGRGL